jgi:hypothetical protein
MLASAQGQQGSPTQTVPQPYQPQPYQPQASVPPAGTAQPAQVQQLLSMLVRSHTFIVTKSMYTQPILTYVSISFRLRL